jgi:hypothetical protein
MKLKPYVEKIEKSKEYLSFKKQYPDSFMVAGFFVIDLEMKNDIHQIDYYIPSKKKVAAFTIGDHKVVMQMLDVMGGKTPEKLDISTNVDLDALPGILHDEMRNRSISEDVRKIVAVLQTIDGKKIWNLNCILTGMELLRSHIEDATQSVLKLEKISMAEIIKQVPAQALKANAEEQEKPADKEDLKGEIDKLNKIQQEIEKQRDELNKQLEKSQPAKQAKNSKK